MPTINLTFDTSSELHLFSKALATLQDFLYVVAKQDTTACDDLSGFIVKWNTGILEALGEGNDNFTYPVTLPIDVLDAENYLAVARAIVDCLENNLYLQSSDAFDRIIGKLEIGLDEYRSAETTEPGPKTANLTGDETLDDIVSILKEVFGADNVHVINPQSL